MRESTEQYYCAMPGYPALVLPRTVNLRSALHNKNECELSVAGFDNAGFERAVEGHGGFGLSARSSVLVEIYP